MDIITSNKVQELIAAEAQRAMMEAMGERGTILYDRLRPAIERAISRSVQALNKTRKRKGHLFHDNVQPS